MYKKIIIFAVPIIIIGAGVLFAVVYKSQHTEEQPPVTQQENQKTVSCPVERVQDTVQGSSMEGLVNSGTDITVLKGYYVCHDPQRNDIIIYNYAGNNDPLIKTIRGIPGDNFSLIKTDQGYHILINQAVLTNSQNIPYLLDEHAYKLLSLYVNDYQHTIPSNTYLIMGNVPSGSLDSSKFGLINKSDIVGKVDLEQQ